MVATVRTYTAGHELADGLVSRKDEVKSIIAGIAGFKAYYLVRTETGAVSISIYEDQAAAEESSRVAAAWVGENLPEVEGGTPQISTGDVVIDF